MDSRIPSSQIDSDGHAAASESARVTATKSYLARILATVFGLGNIPVAPGTFGSLAGLVAALLPFQALRAMSKTGVQSFVVDGIAVDPLLLAQCIGAASIAIIGVISSGRAAQDWQQKDPQKVVIDEVSGQHLALLLGSILPVWWRPEAVSWAPRGLGFITYESGLNWNYLVLGFILFRVFDIWKPFPARQAESLPGGWGIMADDWIAGIFAGLCLWAARGFGL